MAKRSPGVLAPEWAVWLLDNALAGEPPGAMVDALVAAGVTRARAHREVTGLLASPLYARCQAEKQRAERLEMLVRLLRTAQEGGAPQASVERRAGLSGDDFLRHYVATCRPVVLVDALEHWPALAWSWEGLRGLYGEVLVEVMQGDLASRAPRDRSTQARRTLPFGAFVDQLRAGALPQTLSLEAYNYGLANPGLAPLLEDVRLDEALFDPTRSQGGVSLWITPRGTFTPLHYDLGDNLFCQILGRKSLSLVSPLATSLLSDLQGMWAAAPVDELLRMDAHADVRSMLQTCELGPADALYLPAGTWHEITTQDDSLHLSVMPFRHAQDVRFYAPATV